MALELKLSLKLTQQLVMTPQLQQAIELLDPLAAPHRKGLQDRQDVLLHGQLPEDRGLLR